MKKILIVLGLILTVILIYSFKEDNKLSCLEITDTNSLNIENKVSDYTLYKKTNYRIIDFLYDIKDNKEIKDKYPINNLFVTSDLIVLNIGHNDLKYSDKSLNDPLVYIDKIVNDYTKIIEEIRKVSKEKIVIIYNYKLKSKHNDYLYNKLSNLKEKFEIEVLDEKEFINYLKSFTN